MTLQTIYQEIETIYLTSGKWIHAEPVYNTIIGRIATPTWTYAVDGINSDEEFGTYQEALFAGIQECKKVTKKYRVR